MSKYDPLGYMDPYTRMKWKLGYNPGDNRRPAVYRKTGLYGSLAGEDDPKTLSEALALLEPGLAAIINADAESKSLWQALKNTSVETQSCFWDGVQGELHSAPPANPQCQTAWISLNQAASPSAQLLLGHLGLLLDRDEYKGVVPEVQVTEEDVVKTKPAPVTNKATGKPLVSPNASNKTTTVVRKEDEKKKVAKSNKWLYLGAAGLAGVAGLLWYRDSKGSSKRKGRR